MFSTLIIFLRRQRPGEVPSHFFPLARVLDPALVLDSLSSTWNSDWQPYWVNSRWNAVMKPPKILPWIHFHRLAHLANNCLLGWSEEEECSSFDRVQYYNVAITSSQLLCAHIIRSPTYFFSRISFRRLRFVLASRLPTFVLHSCWQQGRNHPRTYSRPWALALGPGIVPAFRILSATWSWRQNCSGASHRTQKSRPSRFWREKRSLRIFDVTSVNERTDGPVVVADHRLSKSFLSRGVPKLKSEFLCSVGTHHHSLFARKKKGF